MRPLSPSGTTPRFRFTLVWCTSSAVTRSLLRCHRAGLKLDAALSHFGVEVAGRTALDAGLSTGGFADCLLQRGAARVYGVDVGNALVGGCTVHRVLACEHSMVALRTHFPGAAAAYKGAMGLWTLLRRQLCTIRGGCVRYAAT